MTKDDDHAALSFKDVRAAARNTAARGGIAERKSREKKTLAPHDARRDPRTKGPVRDVQLNVTVQAQVKKIARMAKIDFDMTLVEFVEMAILELDERLRKGGRNA